MSNFLRHTFDSCLPNSDPILHEFYDSSHETTTSLDILMHARFPNRKTTSGSHKHVKYTKTQQDCNHFFVIIMNSIQNLP